MRFAWQTVGFRVIHGVAESCMSRVLAFPREDVLFDAERR